MTNTTGARLTSAQRAALRSATTATGALAVRADDLRSLLDENEELRRALGGIDQHMVWSAHYVSGNTFAVMCRCGWSGSVEGDDSSFKKRAAAWADHVRARAALSEETKEETNGYSGGG